MAVTRYPLIPSPIVFLNLDDDDPQPLRQPKKPVEEEEASSPPAGDEVKMPATGEEDTTEPMDPLTFEYFICKLFLKSITWLAIDGSPGLMGEIRRSFRDSKKLGRSYLIWSDAAWGAAMKVAKDPKIQATVTYRDGTVEQKILPALGYPPMLWEQCDPFLAAIEGAPTKEPPKPAEPPPTPPVTA